MSAPLTIQLNGKPHTFADLMSPLELPRLIESLGLKSDRIAIERNGEIVFRATWNETLVAEGDRLEIVQFVGGGCGSSNHAHQSAAAARSASRRSIPA
jgi:sulfur carrier protein